ncbi:MAG: amidoligase family protein [Syntrophobacteraceae bacterium]
MEGSQELVAKLRKKYPMLHHFTDRPFGVEIEFYGLDYFILPPDNGIIKPYNVHSRAEDGRSFLQLLKDYGLNLGADRDSWHLEEDASITHRGGAELISPILRGLDGLMESYRFFQFLGEIRGAQIDESCGFHVHHGVDAKHYRCANLQGIVRIVYAMEDYVYRLIAGGRNARDTCRPMDLDAEAFLKAACSEDECAKSGCRLKELWYSRENRYDPDCKRSPRYDMTRYHGLNLHSYWYRSTIEFRYHSAVLRQINEAMQWIIFTQFLIEMSDGHIPTIDYLPNENKWMKAIFKIYLALGHMNRVRGWRTSRSNVSAELGNQMSDA